VTAADPVALPVTDEYRCVCACTGAALFCSIGKHTPGHCGLHRQVWLSTHSMPTGHSGALMVSQLISGVPWSAGAAAARVERKRVSSAMAVVSCFILRWW
jgi:hypothetical protein